MTLLLASALTAPGVVLAQAEEAPGGPRARDVAPAVPSVPAPEAEKLLAEPAPTVPAPTVPPPAVAPPPAAAAKVAAPGLVLIAHVGFNLPIDSMAESYSAGARLGVLAGWHLRPRFSLNGEATFDLMDADADSSFAHPHEYFLDLCVSPLLHLRSGAIVLGPKLGWFINRRWGSWDTFPSGAKYVPNLAAHQAQGITVGLNLGAFAALGKLNLGMMGTVAVRQMVTTSCDDYACGPFIDPIMLGLSVAALL